MVIGDTSAIRIGILYNFLENYALKGGKNRTDITITFYASLQGT